MVFKKKNLFFIGLIIFIVLVFCFYNNVFAAEEEVDISYANLSISNSRNYFSPSQNSIGYFEIEEGYIYHIICTGGSGRSLAVSQSLPDANVTYQFLGSINNGETYDYIGDNAYFYFSYYVDTYISVTREKISGFDNTTNSLVDSVSLDNLWSVVPPTLIALGVLFAIGYIVVKKVLKRDSNVY